MHATEIAGGSTDVVRWSHPSLCATMGLLYPGMVSSSPLAEQAGRATEEGRPDTRPAEGRAGEPPSRFRWRLEPLSLTPPLRSRR